MTDQGPSLREIWQLMHTMNASLVELKASQDELKASQGELKASQHELKHSLEEHKSSTAASLSSVQMAIRDVWKLQGSMNQRIDLVHDEMSELKTHVGDQISELRGRMVTGFGALRALIEARDFRLDDQARRISRLENPNT